MNTMFEFLLHENFITCNKSNFHVASHSGGELTVSNIPSKMTDDAVGHKRVQGSDQRPY